MNQVAWLHDDALRHWYGDLPAIYVFDDERLKQEQWSLKRIGFIYECLLELPVEIRRGNPVELLKNFQVIVMDTPDPWLREQISALREKTTVEVRTPDPFVDLPGKFDLRRFSRYWTKAERALGLGAHNQRT